jgi:hypothetical protein
LNYQRKSLNQKISTNTKNNTPKNELYIYCFLLSEISYIHQMEQKVKKTDTVTYYNDFTKESKSLEETQSFIHIASHLWKQYENH